MKQYMRALGLEAIVMPEIDKMAAEGWRLHTIQALPVAPDVIGGQTQIFLYAVMERERPEEEERIIG